MIGILKEVNHETGDIISDPLPNISRNWDSPIPKCWNLSEGQLLIQIDESDKKPWVFVYRFEEGRFNLIDIPTDCDWGGTFLDKVHEPKRCQDFLIHLQTLLNGEKIECGFGW